MAWLWHTMECVILWLTFGFYIWKKTHTNCYSHVWQLVTVHISAQSTMLLVALCLSPIPIGGSLNF